MQGQARDRGRESRAAAYSARTYADPGPASDPAGPSYDSSWGHLNETRPRVEPESGPHSPLVRVRGLAPMGAPSVHREPLPGERPRRLPGRG